MKHPTITMREAGRQWMNGQLSSTDYFALARRETRLTIRERLAAAARPARPWLRIKTTHRWARLLIAGGARTNPSSKDRA